MRSCDNCDLLLVNDRDFSNDSVIIDNTDCVSNLSFCFDNLTYQIDERRHYFSGLLVY